MLSAGTVSLDCIGCASIASYELLPVHLKACDIKVLRQPVLHGGNVTPRVEALRYIQMLQLSSDALGHADVVLPYTEMLPW